MTADGPLFCVPGRFLIWSRPGLGSLRLAVLGVCALLEA